jgi:hypothetical protein
MVEDESGPRSMVHIYFPSLQCVRLIKIPTHQTLPCWSLIGIEPLITLMGEPPINGLDIQPNMDAMVIELCDLYNL